MRSGAEKKKKNERWKDEWKERGGGKDRNWGGCRDPEAIMLSCSVRLCPELHLTLRLCLSYPVFLPPSLSSTAPKLPHVNTHHRSVYLTAQGQIHTWVRKTPSWRLFLVVFELLALGWPLGSRAGAKAGHMALPYHTQSPGLCHSFLTPSSSAPLADKRGAVRGLGGRLTLTCVTRCPLSHSAGG